MRLLQVVHHNLADVIGVALGQRGNHSCGLGSPEGRLLEINFGLSTWLTEPNSMPAKPPWPRDPTTSRSAPPDNSMSTLAGFPASIEVRHVHRRFPFL